VGQKQSAAADKRHPDIALIGALEKSGAKQTRAMKNACTAPHHHQALEHEG
jgi:hypothetical protein